MAITQHRLADAARRYHRQAARQNEFEELFVTFAGDAPNMEAESYGNPEGLKRAIECLPPRQRTAIQLLKLREMSLKEAAEASGSSIDALKVSVHRGMATLRQTLRG
jgi:RNA polymerase sigma-70 factor (ECF subfamily)